MDKRSLSSSAHQPYHAVSEMYSKEVTHRPIGSTSEFPPEILEMLKDRQTPPLLRSRENTWTPENYPIVRVPSDQKMGTLEFEKFTRRSISPDPEPLRRQSEAKTVPTYQITPPTPEKTHGIPLSDGLRKPLPMYEEYVKMQNSSKSPESMKYIDSSSSTSSEDSEDGGKRFVYSHDVYVDSTTGRPFTPGREAEKKSFDKLKINVYIKPPRPPVEATYRLDEIEIEKQNENSLISKLRPSKSAGILGPSNSENGQARMPFPIRNSVLRKETEILTVPLNRSVSLRQSRISETSRRSLSRTITERSIPIHVDSEESLNIDDVFPKVQKKPITEHEKRYSIPSTVTPSDKYRNPTVPPSNYSNPKETATPELPYTRGISKTPSEKEFRGSERSKTPSSIHIPFNNPEKERAYQNQKDQDPDHLRSSIRSTVTPSEKYSNPTVTHQQKSRQSPEELDYGRYTNYRKSPENVSDLPYTRGISKTPSEKEFRGTERGSIRSTVTPSDKYRNPTVPPSNYSNPKETERSKTPSSIHIPYNNPEKERAYQNQKDQDPDHARSQKSETPELPYTRGISKTPSEKEFRGSERFRDRPIPVTVTQTTKDDGRPTSPRPSYRPFERTRSKSGARSPSSKPKVQSPYEEIVHIKERYERDETIRRFFPTTTTV